MPFNKRKAFGQHFLRDTNITSQIAESAWLECKRANAQKLFEIGPGKGAITHPISEILKRESAHLSDAFEFFLCEKDDRLAHHAREAWQVRVENQDFLDLPEANWLPNEATKSMVIVSNLPYSVGTAILTRLAVHTDRIAAMVLMFQAEVAQRVRAQSRTPDWGSLSVWIQNCWEVEKLLAVPPRAFIPPPKVNSEVIVLRPRLTPLIDVRGHEPIWQKLLKTTFAHRRKMLRASYPKEGLWRNALDLSGVSGTKRAEELTWEDWQSLFQATIRASESSRS